MNDLKRYRTGTVGGYPRPMIEDPEGAWVRYEDVVKLLEKDPSSAFCEWPECGEKAMCSSGNYGNRLVCAKHFKITNGIAVNPPAAEVWAVEDAGITHRYIAHGEEEAREIHRGFQPIDVEERWVVRRVP